MTAVAAETAVTENEPQVENVEAPVEAEPILANLADADATTQATVPIYNILAANLNAIVTRNSSKTRGVDEIAADLFESSADPKVVAIREKIAELTEQAKKSVLEEAKKIKAESGEPDLEAEKAALTAFKGVASALSTFPDGKKVSHFLTKIVEGGNVRGSGSVAKQSGPKNDLTAVRVWARANGFPDVADKGRMSADVLEAYSKANPGK
jgi:hypothetical protein